jgi:phospholipid/cholesterol/gamma-HCH transport system substrate-binding protein/paraquat-inducible protein B
MSAEAKVGVFVIASVAVLGSAIYYVRTTQNVRGQVPYRTYLRYAGGLATGATVLFGGIKVGQVNTVRPASEDPTRIEIAFDVKTGTPMNMKSTAQVGTVSIMSSPALSITTGSNDARRLSAGDVVPSQEAVSLEEITRRVAGVTESANALMTTLNREVPLLSGDARKVLSNLNEISGPRNRKQIEGILADLNTVLNRESPKIAQITDRIVELAKHADSVVVSLEPVVANVDRTVTNVDNTVQAVRDPLTKDLAELERTLQQARALLASVQDVVRDNEGDIGETVRNLRATSGNIRALSESLKQRPWSLIRTKQAPDRRVPE